MIIKPFENKYRDDLIFMVLQAKDALRTALLKVVEDEMKNKGINASLVHLGTPKEDWFESYSFYPKHGYIEFEPGYMRKNL